MLFELKKTISFDLKFYSMRQYWNTDVSIHRGAEKKTNTTAKSWSKPERRFCIEPRFPIQDKRDFLSAGPRCSIMDAAATDE